MAISQADLDALDAAIASGALSVEFDGRKINYQNTAQMITAREHTAKLLNGGMQNRGPRIYGFRFTTNRGD